MFRPRGRRVAISGAVRVSSGNWSAPLRSQRLMRCCLAIWKDCEAADCSKRTGLACWFSSPSELRTIAAEAKRLNGLDLRAAGDVIEIGFTTVLTPQEIKDSRVAH